MGVPHVSGAFGDLLDPRFQDVFHDQFDQLADMLPFLYTFPPDNGRDEMKWSGVGAYGDFVEFGGSVNYDSLTQAFDTTATHIEFTNGFQVERKLFDDDQFHIMDQRPTGLATSANRSRQKHGARILNNAATVDTKFYTNTEAVALVSNSHITNAPDASTALGFDNLTTAALTATALASARILMVDFRDDRANFMNVVPDELFIPPNLYEQAFEIVASMGKVDTAENNRNVHFGAYNIIEWSYLNDTNNWFVGDSTLRKQMLFWIDRVALEFAFMEDFDSLVARWRAYMRYSYAYIDWRWVLGGIVS